MTLSDLIEKYKKQVSICSRIDYSDMRTVKANNRAVKEMYSIIELLKTNFSSQQIRQFAELLDTSENNTNLWVAPQLLEHVSLDTDIENKALQIITTASKGDSAEALGFKIWLQNWKRTPK